MTPAQRKTHVLLWLLVGPIALVGLVLAVLWRPPVPVQPGTAPGAASAAPLADDPAGRGLGDE